MAAREPKQRERRRPRGAEARYAKALARLYREERRGIKLGLRDLSRALAALGSPHQKLRFVHVAGTNGKGSTSAMLESCLRAAGYRTGLFTSPHLHRWTERIQVAGRPLCKGTAARLIDDVLSRLAAASAPPLSFFELAFAIACEAFVRAGVDVVVLEVGLGGRLDATNVVMPEVTLITSIGFDHMQYLGTTLPRIAREKAGIQKRGVPSLTAVTDAGALGAIRTHARRVRAPLAEWGRDFGATEAEDGLCLWTRRTLLSGVELSLAGAHQRMNAALAYAALVTLRARGFRVPDAAILKGLRSARWPGRLERVGARPACLFDVAHNPDGMRTLAATLGPAPKDRRRVVVFGAMEDKDVAGMLQALQGVATHFVFARASLPRAADPRRMPPLAGRVSPKSAVPSRVVPSPGRALAAARRLAGPRGEVVVTGSVFLVAEARAALLGIQADPPIRM